MNQRLLLRLAIAMTSASLTFTAVARAAPVSQPITLKGGWNAVFLEVEPPNPDPAVVFSGVPDLVSAWTWNPRTSPVEFLTDPGQLAPEDPYMLAWFPSNSALSDLKAIYGGQAYLVRRTGGVGDHAWTVNGEPSTAVIRWKADSFNFVGFPLVPGSEPLFFDFFSGSAAHAGQDVYRLNNATSTWAKVTSASDRMSRGEAFWVFCKGGSQFDGTLGVQLENRDGLIYGDKLVRSAVTLFNRSTAPASVSVTVSSADPHLKYLVIDPEATQKMSWPDLFSQPPAPYALAAGGRADLSLGVLRAGPPAIPAGVTRTANLVVSNGSMRRTIPVSVTGISYTGLWVGDAVVRKVSQPSLPEQDGPDVARPAGSEFSLRLLVHLDGSNHARLLREVMQLWSQSAGHYVLLANESRLGEFTPGTLRNGEMIGRRISSSAFGFSGYRDLSGSFSPGGQLATQVVTPWDDPLNPFRHKYHPDHKTIEQSYEITRDVTLQFGDQIEAGADGQATLGWSSAEVGGTYKEVLSLRRGDYGSVPDSQYSVHVEGAFVLHKASDVLLLEY